MGHHGRLGAGFESQRPCVTYLHCGQVVEVLDAEPRRCTGAHDAPRAAGSIFRAQLRTDRSGPGRYCDFHGPPVRTSAATERTDEPSRVRTRPCRGLGALPIPETGLDRHAAVDGTRRESALDERAADVGSIPAAAVYRRRNGLGNCIRFGRRHRERTSRRHPAGCALSRPGGRTLPD